MKILFLDDEPGELRLFEEVAQQVVKKYPDVIVVYCENTQQANEEMESRPASILCLDANLHDEHGMTGGLHWYKEILDAHEKHIPLIAMSGHPEIMDTVRMITRSSMVDTWDKKEGHVVLRDKLLDMIHKVIVRDEYHDVMGLSLQNAEELKMVRADMTQILSVQFEIKEMVQDIRQADERAVVLIFTRLFSKKFMNRIRRFVGFEEKL